MASQETKSAASNQSIDIVTSGCLFDLDGTLVLSTDSVEASWREFGERNGIDANEVLKTSHGRRSIDTLKIWKPELANEADCAKFEARLAQQWKHLAKPVPGAEALLNSLPSSRWAVVTSGTYVLASAWFDGVLNAEIPKVFVTANDIKEGKPDPEGYLKAHNDLGLSGPFLVFEDAPAGIKAGKSAGGIVIGLATTYDAATVKAAGADLVIHDLTQVKLKSWNEEKKELTLTLTGAVN